MKHVRDAATCAPAWVMGNTYNAGDMVSYNTGAGTDNYTALVNQTDYAGTGWDPTVASLWQDDGGCGSATATASPGASPSAIPTATPTGSGSGCSAAWDANTAYTGGANVSYNNENYTAAYWTQGNEPDMNSGPAGSGQPWVDDGPCGNGSSTPSPTPAPTATASATPGSGSSGTVYYHFNAPVASTSGLGEYLSLPGDTYTDLIMSNYVAGVLLGHTLSEFYPGISFNKDYLYGTMLGQLLQENIETSLYTPSTNLIDPSAQQSPVMGAGQGGPYQINEYDVDFVNGGNAPQGYALLNYIAIQQNLGFTFAQASTQANAPTPASFNDKYYGPMVTSYFHLNDVRALYALGSTSYSPAPSFVQCLQNLQGVPNAPLDVIINYAYNQGYYGGLVKQSTDACASDVSSFVATYDSYNNASGSSYTEYPYQVRFYLDEIYNRSTIVPQTQNHVFFDMSTLGNVFANAFASLAYVDGSGQYVTIPSSTASAAYSSALQAVSPGNVLDLSDASQRAQIFSVLEQATTNLESSLGTNFSQTTMTQL